NGHCQPRNISGFLSSIGVCRSPSWEEEAELTVFIFVFKRLFTRFSNIIILCGLPFAAAFLPASQWSTFPLGFQLYGLLLLFLAGRLTSIIMEDRSDGILLRIAAAPVTHFSYLLQNLLAYTLFLMILNAVVVLTGV